MSSSQMVESTSNNYVTGLDSLGNIHILSHMGHLHVHVLWSHPTISPCSELMRGICQFVNQLSRKKFPRPFCIWLLWVSSAVAMEMLVNIVKKNQRNVPLSQMETWKRREVMLSFIWIWDNLISFYTLVLYAASCMLVGMKGMRRFTRNFTRIIRMVSNSRYFTFTYSNGSLVVCNECAGILSLFYLQGWNNERVVNLPSTTAGRVILVLDGDPPAHKKKVLLKYFFIFVYEMLVQALSFPTIKLDPGLLDCGMPYPSECWG